MFDVFRQSRASVSLPFVPVWPIRETLTLAPSLPIPEVLYNHMLTSTGKLLLRTALHLALSRPKKRKM